MIKQKNYKEQMRSITIGRGKIEKYLEKLVVEETLISKEDFRENMNRIMEKHDELRILLNNEDNQHGNRAKGITVYNRFLDVIDLPYEIASKRRHVKKDKFIRLWYVVKK